MTKDQNSGQPEKRSRNLIEENLKHVFKETADEELPESLKKLLERLNKADDESGHSNEQ